MKIKNDDKIHKNTVSEKGGIMRLPRPVQAALAAVWIAIVCVCFFNRDRFSVDEVLRFTPSEPWLAAVIMLLLFALKSLSVVVYCGILYAADGILFPLPVAILMNILGTAVMVSVPYFIGRRRGGDIPARIVERFPKAALIKEFRDSNDFLFTSVTLELIGTNNLADVIGLLRIYIILIGLGGVCVELIHLGCLFIFILTGVNKKDSALLGAHCQFIRNNHTVIATVN